MNYKQTLCPNGHCFDLSKTQTCPYCGVMVSSDDKTVAAVGILPREGDSTISEVVSGMSGSCGEDPPTRPAWYTEGNSEKTGTEIKGEGKNIPQIEPIAGWLLSIAGPGMGTDYRIFTGNNSIGRSAQMRISITGDDAISRERHAFIIYDPKSAKYFLRPGDSQGLVYLNGELIASVNELKAHDIIEVGQTKLLFIPACGEKFKW